MESLEGMTPAPETYSPSDVELAIVEVEIPGGGYDVPGDGIPKDVVNVNEVVKFRVKITNNGQLPLDHVTLRIKGLNGAIVAPRGVITEFVSEFVTEELPRIDAHGGSQITAGRFKFKAPASPQGRQNLVSAKLEEWHANLSHIQKDRSAASEDEAPKATFAARVWPEGTGYDPD
ncbi:MAG TPA: hypothetical protein VGD69_09525 [Herpetosiphonaceae bacterium]